MNKAVWLVVGLLIAVMLAACTATGGESETSANGCPVPGEGTLLYTAEAQGYCVLYPSTHTPMETTPGNVSFVVGDLMNVSDPRMSIDVTDAAGMSTADAAASVLAVFGLPDTSGPTPVTLGGQEALVLDNMPGQDINRRVITVHGGQMVDLTFLPIGPDYGEVSERTEALYQLALDSFTFLP